MSADETLRDHGEVSTQPTRDAMSLQEVVLRPIADADVSATVARRLKTAIRLGVFVDGSKLPREQDLASQFGVSAFALREALSTLREQGLLVTKAGKGGGSFVRFDDTSDSHTEDLSDRSTSELRDFGDWTSTITASCAALASRRASRSSVTELHRLAESVAAAHNAADARRAQGRFTLTLAAASQSPRLGRAILALQEEAAALLEFVLHTDEQRKTASALMSDVATAVEGGEAVHASKAAERYIHSLVSALLLTRLERVRARRARAVEPASADPSAVVDAVDTLVTTILDTLQGLAQQVGDVLADGPFADQAAAETAGPVMAALAKLGPPISGAGVLAELGLIADAEYWRAWFLRDNYGIRLAELEDDPDVRSGELYGYPKGEYFAQPRETQHWSVVGPAMDLTAGGTEYYELSFSWPILTPDRRFLGVVGADIQAADLEHHLANVILAQKSTFLLVSADRRVIVTNDTSYAVGDLVPENGETSLETKAGWHVLVHDEVS
jgi:DNA-binding FadR family transcriptional regulator